MKFEKEIKELEAKLEALKVAASSEELPNSEVMRVEVPEDSELFQDMNTLTRSYVKDSIWRVIEFRLYEPTKETYTFDEAKKYTSDHGVRSMTKEEIHYLIAVGVLKAGDKSFWSSSVVSGNRSYAWLFLGSIGSVNSDYFRHNVFCAVRCIGRV
jgi:hypothetical protein